MSRWGGGLQRAALHAVGSCFRKSDLLSGNNYAYAHMYHILVLGSWIKMMMRGWITTADEGEKNSSLNQSFHLSRI